MAIGQRSELLTAVANWLNRADLTSRLPEFLQLAEDRIAQDARIRIRPMEAFADIDLEQVTDGGTVGGTADAITLTPATAVTALTTGLTLSFTATATNTAAVTVAVSGLTATALNKGDGTEALEAGDLINGHAYHIYYDGTRFRLIPPGGAPLPSRYLGFRRVWLDQSPIKKLKYLAPANFWTLKGATEAGSPDFFTIEGDYIVFGPRSDGSRTVKLLYYRRFAALTADADTNWLLNNARGVPLYGILLEAAPFLGDDPRAITWATLYDDAVENLRKADRRDRHSDGALTMQPDAVPV